MRTVASGPVVDAFAAEAESLSEAVRAAAAQAFARPSPCPPWSVADLLYHVRTGVGRVCDMLAAPEPPAGALTSATGYFRADHRFSAETNRDRVATARRGAAALGAGPAIAREFDLAWRESAAQTRRAPQQRLVRTRHGDTMLLTEFLRTRVLELVVHGLDLAAGLRRGPWTTDAAARVVEDLMLPAGTAAAVLAESGWDHATLIAKATGRRPVTESDAVLLGRHSLRRLALG